MPLEYAHIDLQESTKLVRKPLNGDGALTAKIKALFTAAAAINGGYCDEAAQEVRRAHHLGASFDEIMALPNVFLSSRGEGMANRAYRVVLDAIPEIEHHVQQSAPSRSAGRRTLDEAQALEILGASEHGELILQARVMRHFVPDAMLGYALGRNAAWNLNAIDARSVHLMLVTINAAAYKPNYVLRHGDMAREAGATDAELVEAVLCAMPYGGVTSWFGAAEMLNLETLL